jgi:hypothetical protein
VDTMTEASVERRWVFRLGGWSAVVGSVLAGVGNLVHPVTPMDDPEGVARVIAGSGLWVPVHLAIVVGIALMLGGLVALYHSIRGGVAGALARLGLFAGVAGVTIGLVQAFTGEPTEASRGLTIFGPTVITLWLLVVGILLARGRP